MPTCVRCERYAASAELRRLPKAWTDPPRYACKDKFECKVRAKALVKA